MISEFVHNHSILLLKAFISLAFLEFLIIIVLSVLIKRKRSHLSEEELAQHQKLKDAKRVTIDMNGLVDSINNSKALYKQLSTKCHPDRYTAPDMKIKANAIIQEITQNKNNYAVLLQLKSKAEQELNIQFN